MCPGFGHWTSGLKPGRPQAHNIPDVGWIMTRWRPSGPGGSLWRAGSCMAGALMAAAAIAGCSTHSASPSAGTFTPKTPGVLTVATSVVPSPGFWMGTAAHPTGGLEYGRARELAQAFGLKSVRIVLGHFHRIVSGQLGGADLALDLITPTTERGAALDFSAPYLDAAPTIVVRSGTPVPDLDTAQRLRWGA